MICGTTSRGYEWSVDIDNDIDFGEEPDYLTEEDLQEMLEAIQTSKGK